MQAVLSLYIPARHVPAFLLQVHRGRVCTIVFGHAAFSNAMAILADLLSLTNSREFLLFLLCIMGILPFMVAYLADSFIITME